jgi:hypothetical protein
MVAILRCPRIQVQILRNQTEPMTEMASDFFRTMQLWEARNFWRGSNLRDRVRRRTASIDGNGDVGG